MNTLNVTKSALALTTPTSSQEIDLFAIFSVLWRGKLWIVLCSLLAIFAGGYYAFEVATPKYPARAVVSLETKQKSFVDIETVLSGAEGGSEEVNTEVEVLRSRELIARLVASLNLIDDPEFNKTLVDPNPYHPLVLLNTYLGRTSQPPTETEIHNEVIDNVLSVLSVANVRQSLVFYISATTEDPKKSALIANTLADIYIQDALDEKRTATEEASVWLSRKVSELKGELEASELAVTEFKETTQLVNAESLALLSRQLKELRQRLTDVDERRTALAERLANLNASLASSDMATIAAVTNDPRLIGFANAGDSQGFEARLSVVKSQANAELARVTQQYESLINSEQEFAEEIELQSTDLVRLQQLTREAQANGLLYESFLARLKETTIQEGLQRPDSRLLSEAVPRPASSPRKAMILILSAVFGGLLGSGAVLLRELRANSFRSVEALEAFSGLPVLGSIPRAKARSRSGVLDYALRKPTSAFAESVRNLRTSVLMSSAVSEPQLIMSTSSVPGEGKTTVSLTLAQNMAGLGKKVLVLEGDVRKQIFSQYFEAKGKTGFISVMNGETTLEESVYHHEQFGVDLLFGESTSSNAADVFSSQRFKTLLQTLRHEYDYIIVDTAPVLAVPDARIIGRHMDAIVYSVLWDNTSKQQLRAGLSMFASVGIQVTGLVLSNINLRKLKKYGEGGSYDYAGYYEN